TRLLHVSLSCSRSRRHLPPFPTRRSSDLADLTCHLLALGAQRSTATATRTAEVLDVAEAYPGDEEAGRPDRRHSRTGKLTATLRSEEHTSELQSRFDLVCRLLLEKKKQTG